MNKITIVKVPVDGPVAVVEIENELKALQAAVGGGYIEIVRCETPVAGVILVCDEEGRLKGLEPNPRLPGIMGDAFFTKDDDGEDFISLSADEAQGIVRFLS